MFHLPAASDSADIEVLVCRKGDAFLQKGPRRVLPGQMGFFMGADQQSQKAVTYQWGQ